MSELKDRLGASLVLIKTAALSVSSNSLEPVVKLLGALDVLTTELKTELSIEDQEAYRAAVEAARGRLDQASFQSAWQAGRSLPMEQAVVLAQQILAGDYLTR